MQHQQSTCKIMYNFFFKNACAIFIKKKSQNWATKNHYRRHGFHLFYLHIRPFQFQHNHLLYTHLHVNTNTSLYYFIYSTELPQIALKSANTTLVLSAADLCDVSATYVAFPAEEPNSATCYVHFELKQRTWNLTIFYEYLYITLLLLNGNEEKIHL